MLYYKLFESLESHFVQSRVVEAHNYTLICPYDFGVYAAYTKFRRYN
eukprot:SAG11_NODE_21445_length_425_cov_0.598160_2_plen_46_part_01